MAYLGLTLVENLIVSVSIDYRLKNNNKKSRENIPATKTIKNYLKRFLTDCLSCSTVLKIKNAPFSFILFIENMLRKP